MMEELERKIASVRRRLLWFRALDWALWGLLGALILLNLVVLTLKLFPNNVEVLPLAGALLAAGLLGAMLASLFRSLPMFEAALRADTTLELRERLSSAVVLARVPRIHNSDAGRALEHDAMVYARAIQPRRDFRYRVPRHARHTIWPALALAALVFVPQMDVFRTAPPAPLAQKEEAPILSAEERQEVAERIREAAEESRRKVEEGVFGENLQLAERIERLAEDLAAGRESERKIAAEISRLNDEVTLMQREMQRETQPFRQLAGLRRAEHTQDLQRALKDQNFQEAANQMQELAERLQQPGGMTPDEMKQLAEELRQLADQLRQNPAMQDALRQAADAVEQAAEQTQQMAQQQQQESSEDSDRSPGQQAQSQQGETGSQSADSQAQQACDLAAAAMQQAAQATQAMQDMQAQMEALSQLQAQLAQAQNAAMGNAAMSGAGESMADAGSGSSDHQGEWSGEFGNCQGGICEGECDGSCMAAAGNGLGAGIGVGQRPDSGALARGFDDVFIRGQENEGEIIAIFEVDGDVPRGESQIRYRNVPMEMRQNAAEAVRNQQIPVGYRNQVRDYFESIRFHQGAAEE